MNNYATYSELLARVPSAIESLGLAALDAASREIDECCGRKFYTELGVRYFGATIEGNACIVDDLLAVTDVTTQDDDYAYTETWAATDYLLAPTNTYPKTRLSIAPLSVVDIGDGDRAIRITGTWGYGDGARAVPWDATASTGTIGSTGSSLVVVGADVLVGQTLLIGEEQVYVYAMSGQTASVTRAVNGTIAAAHTSAIISTAAYPSLIRQATIWLAEMTLASVGRNGLTGETIGDYAWRSEANAALRTRKDLRDIMLTPHRRTFGI